MFDLFCSIGKTEPNIPVEDVRFRFRSIFPKIYGFGQKPLISNKKYSRGDIKKRENEWNIFWNRATLKRNKGIYYTHLSCPFPLHCYEILSLPKQEHESLPSLRLFPCISALGEGCCCRPSLIFLTKNVAEAPGMPNLPIFFPLFFFLFHFLFSVSFDKASKPWVTYFFL